MIGLKKHSKLAIDGGPKAVTETLPPWPYVTKEVENAVLKALRTRHLSIPGRGGVLAEFEEKFKTYQGRKYALVVNGGTAALDLGIVASGAGPGDEVIVSPYTWGATVGCILHYNAIPVFADIDPRTLTIDPKDIERKITPRTRAIVTVHIYGHPCDMRPIMKIARKHNLIVVEDCAQAHGATYYGKKVGSLGHVGAFSLQGSKNLIAGEGGIVLCDSKELYHRMLLMGFHPARTRGELKDTPYERYVDSLGFNYRAHPLGIAIANAQLRHLDRWVAARQANAAQLNEAIADLPGVDPTYIAPGCTHGFHMIPLFYRAEELGGLPREAFIQALRAEGVSIGHYVTTPIHLRPTHQDKRFYGRGCPWDCPHASRKIVYRKGDCPVAEKHCEEHELTLSPVPYVRMKKLMSQIALAFRKVTENAERVKAWSEASRV